MDDAHSVKDMSSAPFPLAQPVEDLVPGSVRLFEQDGREVGNGELLLSPAPSSDVDDPLNVSNRSKFAPLTSAELTSFPLQWSKGRKILSLLNIVLFTASMGFSTGVLFSIYLPFSEATGISIGELNSGA